MAHPPPWHPRAALFVLPALLFSTYSLVHAQPASPSSSPSKSSALYSDNLSTNFFLTYRPQPLCDATCVGYIRKAVTHTRVRRHRGAGCSVVAEHSHLHILVVSCEAARSAPDALHIHAALRRIPHVTSVCQDAVIKADPTDSRDRSKPSDGGPTTERFATLQRQAEEASGSPSPSPSPGAEPSPRNWGLARMAGPTVDRSCYPREGAGVRVYVIDTGCRTTHEVFAHTAVTAIPAPDSQYESGDDDNGHGTHIGGVVAGGAGVGLAPGADLVCIKAFDRHGRGRATDVLAAVELVLQQREKERYKPFIVNLSYSALTGLSDTALDAIVYAASAQGVVFVVAAGNAGVNACLFSPSKARQAITVTASTRADALEGDSNIGPCVEFVAPGHEIVSAGADSDTQYDPRSGTSMAAPHVAGLAALVLAENNGLLLSHATVRDTLYHRMINGSSASVATFIMPLLETGCDDPERKEREERAAERKAGRTTKAQRRMLKRRAPPPSPSPSQSVPAEPTPELFPPNDPSPSPSAKPWNAEGSVLDADYWEHWRREELEEDLAGAEDVYTLVE